MGVSPVATGDRGSAPGPRNLFEKRLIKNFSQKSFFICFDTVPLSLIGLLFSVSFSNGREDTADSILGPLPKMLTDVSGRMGMAGDS